MQQFIDIWNNVIFYSFPLPLSETFQPKINLFGMMIVFWCIVFATTIIHGLLTNNSTN